MKTLNLKQEYKSLYAPSATQVEFVRVPCLQFAMIYLGDPRIVDPARLKIVLRHPVQKASK